MSNTEELMHFFMWHQEQNITVDIHPSIPLYIISLRKIEKVPRSIEGEKSRKDMASSKKLVSTIGA